MDGIVRVLVVVERNRRVTFPSWAPPVGDGVQVDGRVKRVQRPFFVDRVFHATKGEYSRVITCVRFNGVASCARPVAGAMADEGDVSFHRCFAMVGVFHNVFAAARVHGVALGVVFYVPVGRSAFRVCEVPTGYSIVTRVGVRVVAALQFCASVSRFRVLVSGRFFGDERAVYFFM